jgi:hypothetical protein
LLAESNLQFSDAFTIDRFQLDALL